MPGDFNAEIVDDVAHRPWPLPATAWIMKQSWHDLLFAHWAVEEQALRSRIPAAFELDRFDGRAWIGIVPFRMTNVAPRGVPPLAGLSSFPELNVRTYVRVADRPGVYFFSLDAGSRLAVRAARWLWNLPYHEAAMQVRAEGDRIEYQSLRIEGNARPELRASYEPLGQPFLATPGSLDHFLTERYCLYHHDRRGRPYRLEIHHGPWRLQSARARIERNTMAAVHGEPLLHFAKRQDMVGWAPTWL
jgi:uncharacterized protein